MATTRIFGYSANSGLTIPGTTRYGNIYAQDFSASLTLITGVTWYMGPDEDLGYIISNKYTPPPPPTTIGDTYQGGIVFYITAPTAGATSGTAGLISKTADMTGTGQWGCYGTAISGADGTAIGTGNQNTIDIVNQGCSHVPAVANYCYNLTDGTYSDWWLPSKDELNQIYIYRKPLLVILLPPSTGVPRSTLSTTHGTSISPMGFRTTAVRSATTSKFVLSENSNN